MDYFRRLKHRFYTLNLFESALSSINEFQASTERLSTRIYLIVLLISLTISTVYFSLSIEIKTFIIDKPSQITYEKLQKNHASTLLCPCSTNTILYRNFLSISPVYHEICSSGFISDQWLTSLHNINRTRYYQLDFRATATSLFQLLRTFCEWNKRKNQIAINQFETTMFLSRFVISPEDFIKEAKLMFSFFDRLIVRQHEQIPFIVLESVAANQLVPAVQTIGVFKKDNHQRIYLSYGSWRRFCFCSHNGNCRDEMRLYNDLFSFQSDGIYNDNLSPYANVSGFLTGCYVLYSLRLSNLQCLYDQTCVDLMKHTNYSFLKPLERHSNKSMISSTSGFIGATDYFIRHWQKNARYSNYYNICSPSYCQYSIEQRVNLLSILTNIFSLYGGLIMVYQMLIPIIVTKVRMWWTHRGKQPANVDGQNEVLPIRTRLLRLFLFVRSILVELNVFTGNVPPNNLNEIQSERLATRVYIMLLLLISLPLLLANIFTVRVHIETKENLTEPVFEQLHSRYGNSLRCLCRNIIIPFDEFSQNTYKMHRICKNSQFINSEWFLYFPFSIRHQFTMLNSICERSRTTIDIAHEAFRLLEMKTEHVMPRELLYTQMHTVHHQLQAQTKAEILTPFHLNRILMHSDKLMTRSHIPIYHPSGEIETIFSSYNNGTCNCALTSKCIIEIVPSFYIGCYPTDSLLQSTLECFYSTDCVALLESFRPNPMSNTTVLNPNETGFARNTTIESMLDALMLEEWNIKINYTKYYTLCNPNNCTYSYPERANLISGVILSLSLLSGLNVLLKLLVPMFFKIIRTYFLHRRNHFNFKVFISSWNTFPSYASRRGDINRLNTEKSATQTYVVIFILCFISIAAYKIVNAPMKAEIVYNPTQSVFQDLEKKYGLAMTCPCKQISMNYGSFLSISPIFHQVCSSYWISPSWFSFLFETSNSTYNHLFILSQFQFLSYICQISRSFASHAIFAFTNDTYISLQVIRESTFNSETSSLMSKFLFINSKSISEIIEFMQGLTHGSGIVSALYTNWKLVLSNEDNITMFTDPISYGNCSCGVYSSCTEVTMIPGLRIGCYPSSAMMQSTLECFYNTTCISMFFGAKKWATLSIDNRSRFSPSQTIKAIIEQLMIEQWINITNYTLYYEKCAPTSCSYSYPERFNYIYIITMLTSLYGGLTMVLRVGVYYVVTYIRSLARCRRRVGLDDCINSDQRRAAVRRHHQEIELPVSISDPPRVLLTVRAQISHITTV
ncbi:unnamed protein product [Adineta ricciae]|uniref:Uncharacterized protein n=1 Tax=Adineta ricciae TaxID=249248 RepID=A0A814IRP2_ADIRI|nr:unnamed protein product [Adineta ricciae]